MRISDWSSDVCSSDLIPEIERRRGRRHEGDGRDGRICAGDEPRGRGKNQVKRWTSLAAIAAALCSPALAQEMTVPSGDTPPPAATEIAPTATTAARQEIGRAHV